MNKRKSKATFLLTAVFDNKLAHECTKSLTKKGCKVKAGPLVFLYIIFLLRVNTYNTDENIDKCTNKLIFMKH